MREKFPEIDKFVYQKIVNHNGQSDYLKDYQWEYN
jgi:hypothetical protein